MNDEEQEETIRSNLDKLRWQASLAVLTGMISRRENGDMTIEQIMDRSLKLGTLMVEGFLKTSIEVRMANKEAVQ